MPPVIKYVRSYHVVQHYKGIQCSLLHYVFNVCTTSQVKGCETQSLSQ